MAKKVILTADKTCDLSEELLKRYDVGTIPLHIVYDGKSFDDNVDIFPEEIYERFYKNGALPTTAAISVGEYMDYFKGYLDQGCEVVHVSIGSSLSCSYANACLASDQLGAGVYVVDSQNLSSGSGLLVLQAAERIAKGMEASQIADEVRALVSHSHASFILDTLKFMAAGGRCSAVMALGANLLQIKPSIEVHNDDGGSMGVGKKYRGKFNSCVSEYVRDELARHSDISTDYIFVTHSGCSPEVIEAACKTIKENMKFKEIFVTRASCTISSHCGPNCIGILFLTK